MERQKVQDQNVPKPWGETWSFNAGGTTRVVVTSVEELIASGVFVSPIAVEGNWGKEAAEKYVQAQTERRMAIKNKGI